MTLAFIEFLSINKGWKSEKNPAIIIMTAVENNFQGDLL